MTLLGTPLACQALVLGHLGADACLPFDRQALLQHVLQLRGHAGDHKALRGVPCGRAGPAGWSLPVPSGVGASVGGSLCLWGCHPCPLGCCCLGSWALPMAPSGPCQSPRQLAGPGWAMGGRHFPARFRQPSRPAPAFPLCGGPTAAIPCLPVLQIPVPIHGPAGSHVTQCGAALWVSQPLLHCCWLRVLGRRQEAGGVVPVSWHPACPVPHAAGGGVPREPLLVPTVPRKRTFPLSRFKYVIGIGVGAGAYVLAKFAVSLGLEWAGPELPVPAGSPGHGEEQEGMPWAAPCYCEGSWRAGGPGWQCHGHGGWAVLPQVSHRSQDGATPALCNAQAVVVAGGCPGRISPSC